jgi:four helix bundle protein
MDYKELKVWKKSMLLASDIYRLTKNFPKNEQYGLVSQIRRAAVSVPSNIAEGYTRMGDNSLSYFLKISFGSISELETQIILSYELEYLDKKHFEQTHESIIEIRKMLIGFIKKIS